MLKPKIHTYSIVLIGNFNPSIVQPFWLSQKGLIGNVEAENADINVIHDQLSSFELPWVNLETSNEKLIVQSHDPMNFEPVTDLAVGIIDVLRETPIEKLGLNHTFHHKLDKQKYSDIGSDFVKLDLWEDVLEDPKMVFLNLQQRKESEEHSGTISIRIAASAQIRPYGIVFHVNDHFDFDSSKEIDVPKLIAEQSIVALKRAEETNEKIWKKLGI